MEYYIIFCLGGFLFYAIGGLPRFITGMREVSRARALMSFRRAPLLRVKDVREGRVRVRGRVRVLRRALRSPDNVRECVAFEEQQGVLGKVETGAVVFELESGGSKIRVEADQPVLVVQQVRGILGEWMRLVAPGEMVTVYGEAVRVPDLDGPLSDYRHEGQRIVIRAPAGQPLYIERGRSMGLRNIAVGSALFASALGMIGLLVIIWV